MRPSADNSLMPLFEAVHNALHAVDDLYLTEVAVKGRIKVTNVVFQHGPCIRDPSNRLVYGGRWASKSMSTLSSVVSVMFVYYST